MSVLPDEFFRYLLVSERDIQWDFYVTGAGCSSVPPQSRYPRSVHPDLYQFAWDRGRVLPEHQVLYIARGDGVFESEPTGQRRVAAGNVLCLFPGVWHRYRPSPENGWDEYWVSYSGDYPRRLVERGFFSPREAILNTGLDDAILHAYHRLLEHVRSEPVGCQQLIAADAMTILAASLAAVRTQRQTGRTAAAVEKAKTIFEENVENTIDMRKLAASLHLSYAHFRHVFRQRTGLSPHQYHLQLRIRRAREMLHGTTLAVKQVARRLNFESPYYFSKLFKRKTGLSPSQWRRGGR
jgi:AraC-like DNA-binding protein